MNKKIIAREFLYFLISLLLLVILYFSYFFIDLTTKNKLVSLQKEIWVMENFEPYVSLQKYVKESQRLRYYPELLEKEFPQFRSYDKQALKDYCATVEKMDYSFIELNSKFPEFGFAKDGSHPNFDLIAYNRIKNEISDVQSNTQYFSEKVILFTTFLIFILFFVIRYLIYATVWSIKHYKN